MTDAAAPARPKTALNARRSFWLKQLHQWHWISAALSLIGLLLPAVQMVRYGGPEEMVVALPSDQIVIHGA